MKNNNEGYKAEIIRVIAKSDYLAFRQRYYTLQINQNLLNIMLTNILICEIIQDPNFVHYQIVSHIMLENK